MINVLVIIDRTRLADLIDPATWLSQCQENCASIVIHCSHVHSIVKRLNTQEHYNNMTVY